MCKYLFCLMRIQVETFEIGLYLPKTVLESNTVSVGFCSNAIQD